MKFKLDLVDLPDLRAKTLDGIRYYDIQGDMTGGHVDSYPSVTSVIGKVMDKGTGLQEWRDRIGHDAADDYTRLYGRLGSSIHSLLEHYVRTGDEPDLTKLMPTERLLFKQMRKPLEESLHTVYGIELALWSDKLKIAGRCDLIGTWNGRPAIIDHKNSAGDKRREHIESYFIQTALYAFMFYERTGIVCHELVVLIGSPTTPECSVYVEKACKYLAPAQKIVREYYAR